MAGELSIQLRERWGTIIVRIILSIFIFLRTISGNNDSSYFPFYIAFSGLTTRLFKKEGQLSYFALPITPRDRTVVTVGIALVEALFVLSILSLVGNSATSTFFMTGIILGWSLVEGSYINIKGVKKKGTENEVAFGFVAFFVFAFLGMIFNSIVIFGAGAIITVVLYGLYYIYKRNNFTKFLQ